MQTAHQGRPSSSSSPSLVGLRQQSLPDSSARHSLPSRPGTIASQLSHTTRSADAKLCQRQRNDTTCPQQNQQIVATQSEITSRARTINEEEKEQIRTKLRRLVKLSEQRATLQKEKQTYQQRLKDSRPKLGQTLESLEKADPELRVINYQKTLVTRVPKSQHRRPTLATVYQAIENVLGAEHARRVKEVIRRDRELEKDKAARKEDTLTIIPTHALRKVRRDRKDPSERSRARTRAKNGRNRPTADQQPQDETTTTKDDNPATAEQTKLKYTRRRKSSHTLASVRSSQQ